MKTPAGKECSFFYGNYHRGKNHEECRLIGLKKPPLGWTAELCNKCPVPEIQRANACPNMTMTAEVKRAYLWSKPKVFVHAYCKKSHDFVKDPMIGCGKCHDLPEEFLNL